MKNNEQLISDLASDLAPVQRPPDVNVLGLAWLLLSAGFVIAVTQLLGPLRPGAFLQLASEPRFLLETLLGLLAIAWTGLAAFRAAIPAALPRKFAVIGLVLMAIWLAQYLFGLVSPALETSTLGKRDRCFLETMIYAVPPILAALFLMRRLYPLNYVRASMSVGLAAGMLPALYMQLACMYDPGHALLFHYLPGVAAAAAFTAVVAGVQALKWRKDYR